MGLALVAGLVLALAARPGGLWVSIPLALALLHHGVDDATPRRRLVRSFVAFGVMFAVTLAWTRQFNLVGWPVLVVTQAAFFAVAGLLTTGHRPWQRDAAFVAALSIAELARVHFPLGGLPIGGFTVAMTDSPAAPLAGVVGEVGMVTVAAAVAVCLRRLVLQLRRPWKELDASMAVPVILLGVLAIATTTNEVEPAGGITVTTIQAGGPQALKRDQQQPQRVFEDHYRLTRQSGVTGGFIAWPEDVISVSSPIDQTAEGRSMSELARRHDAFIGAGVVERVGATRFRNAYVLWSPSGEIVGRYEKRQRVPFGEYVPARDLIERFVDLSQVPRDAIPGSGTPTIELSDDGVGVRVAVAISYEGMFSRLIGDGVGVGGRLVVIPTNAASYESPRVAQTQVQSARFRSLETGRSVVQSAPTGISAIIDRSGDIEQRSTVGDPVVQTREVELAVGRTLYTVAGDAPLTIVSIVTLSIMWAVRFYRRARDRDPSGDGRTGSC